MTTEQTPEQRARAAVEQTLWCRHDPHHPEHCSTLAALDRLCAERYAAGKVEALKSLVCARTDAHLPDACVIDVEDFKAMTAEAEAEYAACVAEIREAK